MRMLNRCARLSNRDRGQRRTRRTPRTLGALFSGALAGVLGVAVTLIAVTPNPASAWGPPNFFEGQAPERLIDTRTDPTVHRLESGRTLAIDVSTNSGVALNLTAVNPSYRGWLAAYPCASGFQNTSNINFERRQTIANLVVIAPDQGQFVCVRAGGLAGSVDVIVDKYGSFEGEGFSFGPFERILDTRDRSAMPVMAGTSVQLTGYRPRSTQVMNVTVANPQGNGHLSVYPCADGVPETSSSNYRAGINRAATVLATADRNGEVCIFTFATTHLVVDRGGELAWTAVEMNRSTRVVDTRIGRGGQRGTDWTVTLPNVKGRAVALNVTAVRASGPGHVTVYPCSAGLPDTSMLNYGPDTVVPNFSIIKPDADDRVCIHSFAPTDVIVDTYGFIGNEDYGPEPTLTCERQDWSIINTWRAQRGVAPLAQYPNDDLFDQACGDVTAIVLNDGGVVVDGDGTSTFGELTIIDSYPGTCDDTQGALLNLWKGAGPLETPTYTHADMLCMQTDVYGTMTAYWAIVLAPGVHT